MISVDVRADIRSAQVFLRALAGKQGVARATARALNRTGVTIRAEAAKHLKRKRDLPISVIKGAIKLKRATTNHLEARVVVSGRPISMRHFTRLRLARSNGKVVGITGITARIEPGTRARLLMRHGNKAFTNERLGGGLPIMYRKGKKRLPISSYAPVPGLPTVLVQEAIVAALKSTAATVFKPRLEHELKYQISQARAKAARASVV